MTSDTPQPRSDRRRLRWWGGCVVLGLLGLLLVRMTIAAASWRQEWVIPAVTSRGFIIHGLVVVIGAGVLVLLLCWLARAAKARGKRLQLDGESGVAMLEFVMVMPIGLFLVLMMAQSALLLVGHMTVHYASFCAARSAIVYVPLDLTEESDEPNNVIDMAEYHDYTIKQEAMRSAAIWAVVPISSSSRFIEPANTVVLEDGLREVFDTYNEDVPDWMLRLLERKFTYADEYTEAWLEFPDDGGDTYGEDEVLRANVQHTFYLSIPYAGRLYALLDRFNGTELDFADGEYGMVITASCRLTNEGVRDMIEMEDFPHMDGDYQRLPWYAEWLNRWDW